MPAGTGERVLAAAEAVFGESGLKGQIEEVARRAGVGVGTVCRNFPTKQALVEAVLTSMYESLLGRALEALSHPDPGEAFEQFFVALPEFQSRHRALGEQMAKELELPSQAQPLREELVRARGARVARAGIGRDPRRHRAGRRLDAVRRCRPRDRARR